MSIGLNYFPIYVYFYFQCNNLNSVFFIIQMDVKNDLLSSVLDLHVLSLQFPIYDIKLFIIIPKHTFLSLSSYIFFSFC